MGDERAPTTTESTEDMLKAYEKYFPGLLKLNLDNILPAEKAKVEASQVTSPAYAKLQQELYDIYGPLLGKTSNAINAEQAKSQAESDLGIVKGTGRELVKEAIDTQKIADPEYYKAREQMGGRLGDLLTSIDLTGGISGGEREEMNRGLARENASRGLLNTPSQTAALSNALQFGQASYNRQNQAKGQLAAALGVGNGFLPTAQSGLDTFKIGTGKFSMPNAGDSKFTGVDKNVGDTTMGSANNFMNMLGGFTAQQNDINANRRDVLDRMNEVGHALGSLT